MAVRFEFDQTLKRLLVVGGLSCSGKTTFINALRQNAVSSEIQAALPDDTLAWRVVGAKETEEPKPPASPRGQIVQCDLTSCYFPEMRKLRPGKFFRTFHHDDPTFKQWLTAVDEIFVVVVRTPRTQLLQQVSLRSTLVYVPPFARRFAARYAQQLRKLEHAVPDWVPNLARRLGPSWRSRALVREQHALLAELYGRPVKLDALLEDWAGWLANEGDRRVKAILNVEPLLGADGGKCFRLIR